MNENIKANNNTSQTAKIIIGVLALQGAVREHIIMLEQAGATAIAVKKTEQLQAIDGLVIPGGESTTIAKLMHKYGFMEAVREFSKHKPVMGTCAGLIVLAKRIVGQEQAHLGILDVAVERNAFGRQVDSFEETLTIKDLCDDYCCVFIRAPLVEQVLSEGVEVLSTVKGRPVIVKQAKVLGISFHPELTGDNRIHKYFIEMVKSNNNQYKNPSIKEL